MGLKLTAKCLPVYFDRLAEFGADYRQFDQITFVNTETKKEKTFGVAGIRKLDDTEQRTVVSLTPDIPWSAKRQIYAIELIGQKRAEL